MGLRGGFKRLPATLRRKLPGMVAAKLLSSGVLLLALATSQSAGPSDRELLQRCWNAQTSDGRHFRVSLRTDILRRAWLESRSTNCAHYKLRLEPGNEAVRARLSALFDPDPSADWIVQVVDIEGSVSPRRRITDFLLLVNIDRVSSHRTVPVEGSGSIYDATLKRATQAVFED